MIRTMRFITVAAIWLAGYFIANSAVGPVPELQQAAVALNILTAYNGARPEQPSKGLYVVYFTPSDREPESRYEQRLGEIVEDIQNFYREGMERNGFGPETFPIQHDAQGELIIHLVKGKEPDDKYQKQDGQKVLEECAPVLNAAGISPDKETVLIFCNLGKWDEQAKTISHHAPYYGSWTQTSGLCYALDTVIQDLNNVPRKEPIINDDEYGRMSLGKFNTIFIGGIAHELGHAFALPHCGERWDEKKLGTSLMGIGNHTYRDERRGEGKGSFLAMASAMRLAGRPLFNGWDKHSTEPGQLQECDLLLSTNVTRLDLNGRRGQLRVEGTVTGSPPIYGIVAYFDSAHDGGYVSPTATSVPDIKGEFAIEISDLARCANGDLRLEFCHANGAVTERHLPFSVDKEGHVDIEQWRIRHDLEPIASAVAADQRSLAKEALRQLEKGDVPKLAVQIARKLAATLDSTRMPKPVDARAKVSRLSLGDARPDTAEVGWIKPMQNRVPVTPGVDSPLLDCNGIYATGLYAHAPSKYVFDLGGKWKDLSGLAGLHTLHQPYGSVIFIIKADGREVYRSDVIKKAAHATYKIDVTGVKQLELIVSPAESSNHNAWGLWLDPILSR